MTHKDRKQTTLDTARQGRLLQIRLRTSMSILRGPANQNTGVLPNPLDHGAWPPITYGTSVLMKNQPQRCMIYVKKNFPREKFETTFLALWEWMFYKGIDISKPEQLAKLFQSNGFSDEEIKQIFAAASSPEFKQALTANTQAALDKGAYGAPWFWVRNSEGKEEPFFGSDRYVMLTYVSTLMFANLD